MNKDQMDGKSLNITEEKLNELKEIIPEVFTESKIDWEKLKAALGEDIEFRNERYVLNWAGKSDAFRVLQSPTTATLIPAKDESVNFDTTGNVFIEGENLEVLKVLQKAYFGKIKMIYIDPPYNTGNDTFIYPDKFSESREEYLSRIGDKDETGFLTREGLFRKNSKDSGHYHSNWLSMMYPRLFLARNLLKDDGVIFVSIDDNEVHNLRLLMNEVFGEENFIAEFIWNKKSGRQNDAKYVSKNHEYIICFCKNEEIFNLNLIPRSEETDKEFLNLNNDPRGRWIHRPLHAKSGKESSRYKIKFPNGIEWEPPKGTYPRFSKEKLFKLYNDNRLWFGKEGKNVPRYKRFLSEVKDGIISNTLLFPKEVGNTQKAKQDYQKIMHDVNFDNPKPIELMKYILKLGMDSDGLILDFFSGSATTTHAALDLNKQDGGNRKFILVQLPEKTDENSEAYKAGYKTIAEIGKERIRRVIKTIENGELKIENEKGKNLFEKGKANLDLGFKVFKLHESNFKIWRTKIETEEELVEQLEQHLEPLDENAKMEDVLYELLLKSGIPLTANIKKDDDIYIVNENEIVLLLDKADSEIIKKAIKLNPQKIVTLDRLFSNNDQLKTNTALQMKDAGIEFKVV